MDGVYQKICKVYGYDKTVKFINSKFKMEEIKNLVNNKNDLKSILSL